MRTVTASLWSLLWLVVLIAKGVLWSILFLRCEDPLVEELCVLASVECVILQILSSLSSFRLFNNGFEFFLFIHSLVIIVILSPKHWVLGVDSQPVLGGYIGQTTSESGPFTVLEILRVVDKRWIVASYIYFVQIHLLFNDVYSWRWSVCILVIGLFWGYFAVFLNNLVVVFACPTEISHPVVSQGPKAWIQRILKLIYQTTVNVLWVSPFQILIRWLYVDYQFLIRIWLVWVLVLKTKQYMLK